MREKQREIEAAFMEWNLLILSDLHLGEQEPGEARELLEQRTDLLAQHFGSFLKHYTHHREKGKPWRLVIAGDMIDFMRIHVPFFDEIVKENPCTPEEASWHIPPYTKKGAKQKLQQVFLLHQETFSLLARFIMAGNELAIISGNHDAEFDWPEIQEVFSDHLYALAEEAGATSPETEEADHSFDRESFLQRIHFFPHYYYEEGRIYIEHGHFYDSYCRVENEPAAIVEDPRMPGSEEESVFSFSHMLTRFQFKTPWVYEGLPLHHVDEWGVFDIMNWIAQRPPLQLLAIFYQYILVTFRLIAVSWSRKARAIQKLPFKEQRQELQRFAEQKEVPAEAIIALRDFIPPPIHKSPFDTIQALYLDRLVLVGLTTFLLTVYLVAPWPPIIRAFLATVTATFFIGILLYLARRRPINQSVPLLFNAAFKVASYLETPLLVFAHTHHFAVREIRKGKLYVNLGAWTVPSTLVPPAVEEGEELPVSGKQSCEIPAAPSYQTPYLRLTSHSHPHQLTIHCWPSQEQHFRFPLDSSLSIPEI